MIRGPRFLLAFFIALCLIAPAAVTLAMAHRPAESRFAEQRFATLDTLACVEQILAAPAFVQPREDDNARWTRRLNAIAAEIEAAATERDALPESDPEREALTARLANLQRDLVRTRDDASRETEAFLARQAADAFARVQRHATELARARGYTHLIAARAPGAPITPAPSIRALPQQVLARPVLVSPPEDDLTEALRERLEAEGLTPDARPVP